MKKLTDAQFEAIKRNADGDIIWLGDFIHMLSDDQIERLTDDDWQRYDEAVNMEYC